MKLFLTLVLSIISLTAFSQKRYATNVIENVDYQIVEEASTNQDSVLTGKRINYRTVRVTDHKKKENGVLVLQFDWKSYTLEIDKDLFVLPRNGAIKTTKLKDVILSEKVCDGETLTLMIQSKTVDPVEYEEKGVIMLTKTKSKSIRIDAKKYCDGFMPNQVIIKSL